MSDELNKKPVTYTATAASSANTPKITTEFVKKLSDELEQKQLESFALRFGGVTVFEDYSGMMAPDNGYVILCGKSFMSRLRKVKVQP